MIKKIYLKNGLSEGSIIETGDLARKGERDLLPLSILNKIDEDGFEVSFEDIDKLNFDNSGRYFENPESSRKQIDKVIAHLLIGIQIAPVIIDLKGNVIDGQHRMCAFKALGITKIPVLKSLVNDTTFDNVTSRANRLGITMESDFYTKENLNENKTYCIYKKHFSKLPTKTEFLTDKYIDGIIDTQKWSDHGADLETFLSYQAEENVFFEKVDNLKEQIKDSSFREEFKNELKKFLEFRYTYVVESLLDEIKDFPLKVQRSINVNDKKKDDILSNKNPENIDFGKYWTTGHPESYQADMTNSNQIILTADIEFDDINWEETLVSRFDYDNGDQEEEIQIKKGKTIKLTKLELDDLVLDFKEVKENKSKPKRRLRP